MFHFLVFCSFEKFLHLITTANLIFSPILLTMKLMFKEFINTSKVIRLLVIEPELKPTSYSKAQLLVLICAHN